MVDMSKVIRHLSYFVMSVSTAKQLELRKGWWEDANRKYI